MPITGYDISSNNPNFAGYDTTGTNWCCIKVSQGAHYKNGLRFAQAAWARSRGLAIAVYHWVEPTVDAGAQIQNMVDALNGLGGFAWWALDLEDATPASDQQWAAVVNDMLGRGRAIPVLGPRDVIYVGQFFHPGALLPIARASRWWLPDYSVNDGAVHQITNGARPMIHQFTSAHGLDRNVVTDEGAYQALCGQPAPSQPPKEIDDVFVYSNSHGTGYLVTDPGKTAIANNSEYQALVKAGVRDAGRLSDTFDAGLALAVAAH